MLVAILKKYQGDMTQEEYAARLGIAQGTLSLIYRGRRGLGMEVLRALSRAFPSAADEIAAALAAAPGAAPAEPATAVAS